MLFPLLQSADFLPGVRYQFSLYSCSPEPPQLLRRWQGYIQELGKSRTEGGKKSSFVKKILRNHMVTFCSPSLHHDICTSCRPQSHPVLSSCQPARRILMLPSAGERLLWSAGGGSSWDTIFTSVVVPSSHLSVGVRNADVIFETATVFHQISPTCFPLPVYFALFS